MDTNKNTRFDYLDEFDGTCPKCGTLMWRFGIDYDDKYDCDYYPYVCMEDGCDGSVNVECESRKILQDKPEERKP